jgi:hypothetical protein
MVTEAEIQSLMEAFDIGESTSNEPGEDLLNYVSVLESPGRVLNEELATTTPCTCYRLPDRDLCFSKGVIGMLTQEQEERYCPSKEYREDGVARRVAKFREAAETCKEQIAGIPKGERLGPWLSCMGGELRKRGVGP